MGDVITLADHQTEPDPWLDELTDELKTRVDANAERNRRAFWDAMVQVDGGGREVPPLGWCVELEYAITALEMIATNRFDGGDPEDEPCFRQGFAARNLAAIALRYCRPRSH